MPCPGCGFTYTSYLSHSKRTQEMVPKAMWGADNQNNNELIRNAPKVDMYTCEAAKNLKTNTPCLHCKACCQSDELQQRIQHHCTGLPGHTVKAVQPGTKCDSPDCDFEPAAVCKCPFCSVASHAVTFGAVFNSNMPLEPYPIIYICQNSCRQVCKINEIQD